MSQKSQQKNRAGRRRGVLDEDGKRKIGRGQAVLTEDGPGTLQGVVMREGSNNGPGCRQYRVQLDDGRIRHYGVHTVTPLQSGGSPADPAPARLLL